MTDLDQVPVLLVDDRPENLSALEELLKDMELDIFKATSGNEALRLTLKHDFAIVLLDVRMPDMDGFETAELMRANPKTRRLPIIFVTAAMKDTEHEFKGYEAGAIDYLLKPVEPTIFRSKVRGFCDLYRQRRRIERREQQLELLVAERTAELNRTVDSLRESESRLRERVMLAELSASIGFSVTKQGDLRSMLQACSEALVQHLNVAFARIWTFNAADNVLELQASAGRSTGSAGSHSRVPVGKFEIGLIAQDRKPHTTNAVLGDPRVPDQEWAKREGMVAFAGHPLTIGDKLVGVVAMFSPYPLTDVTLKVLASVSNEIAIGIERMQTEEKLAFLASIVEFSDEAIFSKTLDETIVSWNRGAERIYGYSAEEIVGKSVSTFVPPGLMDELAAITERLKCGEGVEHLETTRVRKDGRIIHLALTISPIKDAGGQIVGLSTIARDITERKRLENRERTRVLVSEKLTQGAPLREILDAIALGIEEESKGALGSILLLDKPGEHLRHGAAPSLPQFYNDAINGLEIGPGAGACGAAAFSGSRVIVENIQTHPFWRHYRDLAARAGLAACWSEPILNRQGRVIGTFAIYHRAPCAPSAQDFELIESLASLTGVVIEYKQAEEEIRRLNVELEQRVQDRTQQLEAANKELESFSYSVSHDLRAPLRSIDGFSRILQEDQAERLDDEGRESLSKIRVSTQHMGRLIDDMMKLSRVTLTELRRSPVDLSALASVVGEELRTAEPQRSVEWVIEPGLTAPADENLMRIVLENLLGNAWKFTGHQPAPRIEFGRAERDGAPVYFVRDNGAGFEPQYAYKLFQAFQRLHSASEFPGTGIGLATVQRVIHRHGGRVWAEGEPDHGATIFFTLPDELDSD
jgi:PAS domain S-box-containing protein